MHPVRTSGEATMNFFTDAIRRKLDEAKEKREFLDEVAAQAKPLRRKAYMAEALKSSMEEGQRLAQAQSQKRAPQTRQGQYNMNPQEKQQWASLNKNQEAKEVKQEAQQDQWAFLDNINLVKESKKGAKK
jgi:hypothetical protein